MESKQDVNNDTTSESFLEVSLRESQILGYQESIINTPQQQRHVSAKFSRHQDREEARNSDKPTRHQDREEDKSDDEEVPISSPTKH